MQRWARMGHGAGGGGKAMTQGGSVGLALAGFTLWVLTDTSLKYTGASRLPAHEVVAILGLSMVTILLGRGLWTRDARSLWPRRAWQQVVRALLELGNVLCVVIALRHLPLPLFYVLIFLSPLVTTLGAAVFLGEPLGWQRGLAIVTGLAGVVVAVNPWNAARPGDWQGYAACMVCVLCFSANMVWSRVMTQSESRESLIFFSGLVQALAGGAAMLWRAEPVSARMAGLLVAAALFGLLGSLCFFVALKHSSAASVAQYHYSQLVTGALLAYWVFGERVTGWMMAGAVLIVGAGVWTALRPGVAPLIAAR